MLTHKGTNKIETNRLLLRKFNFNDYNDMFNNWTNDDDVSKFLTWEAHRSIDVTKEILNLWISDYKKDSTYNWAIILKDINEVIGNISIVSLDIKNESCEIGYCMSKNYWGIGIMTESLKSIINYLFSEIGFNRIVAKYDTNNLASKKVMLKSGMTFEGVLRESNLNKNNEFINIGVCSILKKEWNL